MTAQEKKPAKEKQYHFSRETIEKQKQARKQKRLCKTKAAVRQRAKIIAQEMFNGSTAIDAVIKAGYSKDTAVTNIINNPIVKKTFNELLDKAGLTDDKIALRMKELSEAKETKFFSHEGEVVETREVDALSIQADMIKFAAKVKGYDKSSSPGPQGSGYIDLRSYQITVNVDKQELSTTDNTVDNLITDITSTCKDDGGA
jgi:hypothetical protein